MIKPISDFKNVLIICNDFRYKDAKDLQKKFNSHPFHGFVYKALYDETSKDLRVYLPTNDPATFGIKFDSFVGENEDFYYSFEEYTSENCFNLNEKSLEYLSSEEMERWENGIEAVDEDNYLEIEEKDITILTVNELISKPDIFYPYIENTMSSLQAHREEILCGVVYSIEDALEVVLEGFKIPLNQILVVEQLQEKLESMKSSKDFNKIKEIAALFFTLSYLVNKEK